MERILALYSNFLPQTIIASDFDHFLCKALQTVNGEVKGLNVTASTVVYGSLTDVKRKWAWLVHVEVEKV